MMDSTLGLVAMIVAGYTVVTVPLMLVTGRILRMRSAHIPFPERCAEGALYPPAPVLRDDAS